MGFAELRLQAIDLMERPVFLMGLLMVLAGLGFKIAAFPMQIWAPDVYQGAPAPVAAFLAVGSKAAGMVLLLRVFFSVVTEVSEGWEKLWMALSAMTILYGNLCAIPQRNLKRLLGYSSIANAGYLLLGAAAVSAAGSSAILYYLAGYLFTVMAAFTVICLAMRQSGAEEIGELAGLHRRSPLLAASMTLAMVSLAGVPPMAGFFGKFLLFRAVAQQASAAQGYYWLMGVAVVGVAISIWYYFGVIRAIYWSEEPVEASPIAVSLPARVSLYVCVAGMIYLGVFPGAAVGMADAAVKALHF
jgi:NADH-quinone oxidoreductase subunit N